MRERYWGANFAPEEISRARREGRLLSLELELSRRCDLRCLYCYADSGTELEDEITLAEIHAVLDQAMALGIRRVVILGGGEPLLYPHVLPIMEYLSRRNIGIDLFTNGTRITPDLARELVRLKVAPVVKMNSMRPQVQDFLAGREGAYAHIRRGLELLLEAGYPAAGLPLGAQTVVCRQNIDELPAMWCWLRDRRIIPYVELLTLQGRARQYPELAVPVDEIQRIFETLAAIDRRQYGLDWQPHPPVAGLSCNRHAYSCTVTVTGDIVPCPGISLPIGNIRRTPLAEILAGSRVIRELRHAYEHVKGGCRDCELAPGCYGCRGMAYQATGDYLAEDPLCWRCQSREQYQ